MCKVTQVTQPEVLPEFTENDAERVENKAKGLYAEAERNYVRFAAELRRLQEGGAHLWRGYDRFGDYAEAMFPGLNGNTAKQLSRQGQVLIVLEKAGKIDLDKDEKLPYSTGCRALAVVLTRYGEDAMLGIYDAASAIGRGISAATVEAAVARIIAPKQEPAELGAGAGEPMEPEDETPEETEEVERHQDILDRISMIHEKLYDVAQCVEDDKLDDARSLTENDVGGEIDELRKQLRNEDDSEWINKKRGQ